MNRPCAFWCYLFSAEPGARKGAKREKKGCSKTRSEFFDTPMTAAKSTGTSIKWGGKLTGITSKMPESPSAFLGGCKTRRFFYSPLRDGSVRQGETDGEKFPKGEIFGPVQFCSIYFSSVSLTARARNSSKGTQPASPFFRSLTATVPSAASLAPKTNI